MRVTVFTAGLFLTSAVLSLASMAAPALAHETKVSCLCDCPDDHKVKAKHAEAPPAPRRMVRRASAASYYSYGAFAPVVQRAWHGAWRVAPNDARIPAPIAYYGPPPGYADDGLHVDERGWSGGVGNTEAGGGGGGGGLGGTVILATGGSAENGPTYNDYNQSFQQNPSVAGPFQNRLMGGLAPAPSSSK